MKATIGNYLKKVDGKAHGTVKCDTVSVPNSESLCSGLRLAPNADGPKVDHVNHNGISSVGNTTGKRF